MSRSTNLAVFFLKCSKRLCRIGRDRHPIFDSIKALSHGQIQKSSSFILCYCKFTTRSLSKAQKIWKKTFPFQRKFNRFPTFHYVRGWLWLVHGQLFRTPLHCRRGCCRFCSLSRFSLALLLIYTVAIRCYWCSRWTEACKSASAQKAVPSRFLEVNFRSNSCRCGWRCRPQFFAPPHRLVQDRCFYPADLFQVVDFTAQRTVSSVLSPHLEIIKWVRWL